MSKNNWKTINYQSIQNMTHSKNIQTKMNYSKFQPTKVSNTNTQSTKQLIPFPQQKLTQKKQPLTQYSFLKQNQKIIPLKKSHHLEQNDKKKCNFSSMKSLHSNDFQIMISSPKITSEQTKLLDQTQFLKHKIIKFKAQISYKLQLKLRKIKTLKNLVLKSNSSKINDLQILQQLESANFKSELNDMAKRLQQFKITDEEEQYLQNPQGEELNYLEQLILNANQDLLSKISSLTSITKPRSSGCPKDFLQVILNNQDEE